MKYLNSKVMEEKILEIMEAGMKRRLIFSDMLELQKIARAVNLATKAHYEAKKIDENQHILLTATINSPCKTDPEYCGWINEVKGCIAQQPTLEKCKEALLELYWVKKSVEHKNKQR